MHNLLVVSDLHFGETFAPDGEQHAPRIDHLNEAFCRFLDYYLTNRLNDRPWRLVVAGDMIDFVRARLLRAGSASERAMFALEAIIKKERAVFRSLAEFVAAGNELIIVKGNHDAELAWEEVQSRFVDALIELAGAEPSQAQGIRDRVSFFAWFYYEEDLVYIEHGNQYDEYCSFEHVLAPMVAESGEVEVPISHHLFHSFAHLTSTLNIHAVEHLKLVDWVRWVAGLGPRLWGRLALTYFSCVSWGLGHRRRLSRSARARIEHVKRLRMLRKRFALKRNFLPDLEALRERPAVFNMFRSLQMLYMDRVLIALATLALLPMLLVLPIPAVIRGLFALGLLGGVGWLCWAIAPMREVEAEPKLRRTARRVAQVVGVPFVIFGHTHVATLEAMEVEQAQAWYLNTGSWGAGEEHGLTHVLIQPYEAKPRAELRRWDISSQLPTAVRGTDQPEDQA